MTVPAAATVRTFTGADGTLGTAHFSSDERYRYSLSRCWDPTRPAVAFVMLNPSTATESVLDPTVRCCLGFAKAWGYGQLIVRNCFALRATDPRVLRGERDPIGVSNDAWLRRLHTDAELDGRTWDQMPTPAGSR